MATYDYAYLGECSRCGMIEKRLWRKRPEPAPDGTLCFSDSLPVCVKCRVELEADAKED